MANKIKPKINLIKLGQPPQLHPAPVNLSKIFLSKKSYLNLAQGFSTLVLLTFGAQ